MAWLHTVCRSPYERDALATCLRLARPGSAVLLLEDAVYAALAGGDWADTVAEAATRHRMHALGPDLAARGIPAARLLPGIRVIDYAGFVDLAAACDRVHAWT